MEETREGTRQGEPLRVGISLVSQGADQTTGSRNIMREVIQEFGRRPAEIEVEVLCNEHAVSETEDITSESVRLVRAKSLELGSSGAGRLASVTHARLFPRRMTHQLSPDTQVTHYPLGFMVPAPRGASVVVIHDVLHRDMPHYFSRAQRAWRDYFYGLAARNATMLITDSEHAALRTIENFGVDRDRVRGVNVAVDHKRFTPDPQPGDDELFAGLGLPPRFVYYPASFWPHKNHLRLVEAIGRLGDDTLHLVLTGAPMGRSAEIMAAAERHGLTGRVHHLGVVPDEAMAVLYRRATAVVFPSFYEGFGMPPAEAMACGCPVASSLSASLAEVCGDAAVELKPNDPEQMANAIDAVANDDGLRARLRAAGLAQSRKFTWQATADAHLEVFHRAIELAA